jgi:hypothetical protein
MHLSGIQANGKAVEKGPEIKNTAVNREIEGKGKTGRRTVRNEQ